MLWWAVVARGRWCVIFSPLCLLPVGQGLLEQGVADLREIRGREVSRTGRKVTGLAERWTLGSSVRSFSLLSLSLSRSLFLGSGRARIPQHQVPLFKKDNARYN